MRRERHNFFNKRAAHFVDPNWSRRGETKNRLSLSKPTSQLYRSEFKYQLLLTQPTRGARSVQSHLASPRSESQLTAFFQIPKILSASRHDVIHVPAHISYLRFLLWHLWFSHPPRTRVNTCAQYVHLTNPCTKRKVLSLTKPKGKIYKTKSLSNYIITSTKLEPSSY